MPASPHPTAPSDLTTLVETERRLEQALVSARATAASRVAEARARTEELARDLAEQSAGERARVASDIAAATAAQEQVILAEASATLARFEQLRGEALADLAQRLARRLGELALAEAPP